MTRVVQGLFHHQRVWHRLTISSFLLCSILGCARSNPELEPVDGGKKTTSLEICDGMDNNRNGLVDEGFLSDAGIYLHEDHCGACNQPCATDEVTIATSCEMTVYGPACRSVECKEGYVPNDSPVCANLGARLCAPCLENGDCGSFAAARCATIAGEDRCTVACDEQTTCPEGYDCSREGICIPPSNSCSCYPGDKFDMACTIDADGTPCLGTATCEDGVLSSCEGAEEVCDGIDNDCNGITDDPFIGENGFYGVDIHNCGACGVDCTLNPIPEQEIACAGPATSPVCAIRCQDTVDGIDVGDKVDADLLVQNLCECTVTSLTDAPAPGSSDGSSLDSNCDGVDGIVAESFYVRPGGNDSGPGSPIKPMGSIGSAVEAAHASLSSNGPRPYVFVAAGSYDEVLTLREGVRVYGGYSPDFNTRNPKTYSTEIHPANWQSALGGAALVAENVGVKNETVVDGVTIKGAAAPGGSDNYAYGVIILNSGKFLRLTGSTIVSGDGADGENGIDGTTGVAPSVQSSEGDLPREAQENSNHRCMNSKSNTVAGGTAERWTCEGIAVSGGDGGSSGCPGSTLSKQPDGNPGRGPAGTPGGAGGSGGSNADGPIFGSEDSGCDKKVCCGLADFLVDGSYTIAGDGQPGRAGADGNSGAGCSEPLGLMSNGLWTTTIGDSGFSGGPGSGGGGGGSGGGAAIEWVAGSCPYPDGLGGGGGAGGAGGCGGSGGTPGTSGGPSVGILLSYTNGADQIGTPTISDVTFIIGNGGTGGHGGHGGDGGQGSSGAKGGGLSPTERITPPLSGSTSGGKGGSGGSGGAGGGGGGGCGGSAIGVWVDAAGQILGSAITEYKSDNTFKMGSVGAGGGGGGGGSFGISGKDGEVLHVVKR